MKEVHILLVEDNEGDIILTKEALKEAKIRNEVSVAIDGEQALDMLESTVKLPDLILLDINLPRLNGLEVLASIRKNARLKDIPVIMLTTSSTEKDILNSYALHVTRFITKPVDLPRFMEVIKIIEDFLVTIVREPKEKRA